MNQEYANLRKNRRLFIYFLFIELPIIAFENFAAAHNRPNTFAHPNTFAMSSCDSPPHKTQGICEHGQIDAEDREEPDDEGGSIAEVNKDTREIWKPPRSGPQILPQIVVREHTATQQTATALLNPADDFGKQHSPSAEKRPASFSENDFGAPPKRPTKNRNVVRPDIQEEDDQPPSKCSRTIVFKPE